jgi:hypothetical protein
MPGIGGVDVVRWRYPRRLEDWVYFVGNEIGLSGLCGVVRVALESWDRASDLGAYQRSSEDSSKEPIAEVVVLSSVTGIVNGMPAEALIVDEAKSVAMG